MIPEMTPNKWKIAGAGVAAVAVGSLGLYGMSSASEDDDRTAEPISLRAPVTANDAVTPPPAPHDDALGSIDGESLDSPLQSADDSPEGGDSVNTPDSVNSVNDSPAAAPSRPATTTAPAPARASSANNNSANSPASASVASAASTDSP